MEELNFSLMELDIPTFEQMNSKDKTKYNRKPYEWAVDNEINISFNITQIRARRVHIYTQKQIKKLTALAVTSTVIAISALLLAIFT